MTCALALHGFQSGWPGTGIRLGRQIKAYQRRTMMMRSANDEDDVDRHDYGERWFRATYSQTGDGKASGTQTCVCMLYTPFVPQTLYSGKQRWRFTHTHKKTLTHNTLVGLDASYLTGSDRQLELYMYNRHTHFACSHVKGLVIHTLSLLCMWFTDCQPAEGKTEVSSCVRFQSEANVVWAMF